MLSHLFDLDMARPPRIPPLVFPERLHGRTRLAQDVASDLREHFGSKVFDSVTPRSVRHAEAPSHGRPISQFDPRSAGADAYYRLALEVVERG